VAWTSLTSEEEDGDVCDLSPLHGFNQKAGSHVAGAAESPESATELRTRADAYLGPPPSVPPTEPLSCMNPRRPSQSTTQHIT